MCKPLDIEALIKQKGLKKSYVAEYLGISLQSLSRKLKGITPFKICEIRVLKELLQIPDKDMQNFFTHKVVENNTF